MRDPEKCKDFSVYDFTEEDEAAEPSSRRYLARLRPRRPETPTPQPITKFNFLRAFSSGVDYKQADSPDMHSADLRMRDNSGSCAIDTAIDTSDKNLLSAEESSGLDEVGACAKVYGHVQISENDYQCRRYLTGSLTAETCTLAIPVTEFSDDDESWTADSKSPSTTTSDLLHNEDRTKYPVSDNDYSTSKEKESDGTEIVLFPDYVLCGTNLFTEAQITFSPDCLKIDCFDNGEQKENLVGEWELADILHMNIQWSEIAEASYVEIYLCENRGVGIMEVDVDTVDGSSSIMRVTFAIHGSYWLEKEPDILLLTERYRKMWNSSLGDEYGGDDGTGSDMCLSRHHLTELEPFEDVVYPKGDPDAVSISKRDIELLQPDTFINDTIIDFYIKYLKNKRHPEDYKRFHFFNSFFFRKLADLDRDRGSALGGQEAFRRVRKWTRKVDIFEKDYIFIPVNYNLHWSLLVICHPGEVAKLKDDEGKESAKLPCVLHMDSIRGNHTDLSDLIRSYLWEEWKERHPDSSEDCSSKFSNLRFLPLELPQQENSSDCGLFLLHYVELFMEEAPVNFSPSRITTFTNFLNVEWFEPSEASHKRYLIRKLIYDLIKDASQATTSTSCSNQNLLLDGPEKDIEQEAPVEFLSLQSVAVNKSYCDSDHCFVEREIDVELVASSPVYDKESHKTKSVVDFLKPGVTTICSLNHQDHPYLQNEHGTKCKESSVEENAVMCKQPASSTENAEGFVFASSSISHTSKSLCSPKSVGACETLMMLDSENVGRDSLPNSLDYHSTYSSEEDVENCGYVPDSPTSTSHEHPGARVEEESAEVDSPINDVEYCKQLEENNPLTKDDVCSSPEHRDKEDTHLSPSQNAGDANYENFSDVNELQSRTDDSLIEVGGKCHKRQKMANHEEIGTQILLAAKDCKPC